MTIMRLFTLPTHAGDYRFAWFISFLIAIAFSPFIVAFKNTVPWLIAVPIALGIFIVLIYEWIASGKGEPSDLDLLITLPSGFSGLKSYEQMLALELRPRKKDHKNQLALFPGFAETTPTNAVRFLQDEQNRQIAVVNCDRYSALIVTYLLDNLDKVTEKSLAAGLARFGKLGGRQNSDIQLFVHDKGVREAIKSDFRGNLVTLVVKGGEKVLRDLLKTVEARMAEEKEKELRSSVASQKG